MGFDIDRPSLLSHSLMYYGINEAQSNFTYITTQPDIGWASI